MKTAYYDLKEIKSLVGRGRRIITASALQGALAMGFTGDDIDECICDVLNGSHFYKPMPADKAPGLWQDVYKLNFQGERVYLKLQINRQTKAVIISFKRE